MHDVQLPQVVCLGLDTPFVVLKYSWQADARSFCEYCALPYTLKASYGTLVQGINMGTGAPRPCDLQTKFSSIR